MATGYQRVDELWSKFRQEMSAVLQTAYQLPEDLQMNAVMEMEETLFIWKKSLTQSLPRTDQSSPKFSSEESLAQTTAAVKVADEDIQYSVTLNEYPQGNFTACKSRLDSSGEEEEPAPSASDDNDLHPIEHCSDDTTSTASTVTIIKFDVRPLGGAAERTRLIPRKHASDSDTCLAEQSPGRKKVKIDDGATGRATRRKKMGRSRKVSALTSQPTRRRPIRIAPAPSSVAPAPEATPISDVKLESDKETGAVAVILDTSKRIKGRRTKNSPMTSQPTRSKPVRIAPAPISDAELESAKEMAVSLNTAMGKRGRPTKCARRAGRFPCYICSKLMATKTSLAAHIRVHTGEKPYTCDLCGKTFSQISGLSTHKKRHTGTKDHHCQYCDFSAIQSIDISRHEMRHHTKEKPYLCDLCGRGFIDVWSLRNHITTHTKHHKDQVCSKCDFKTHSPEILRAHTRNMHGENRKSYPCNLCGEVLRYRDTYTGHMRRHFGEKPYLCMTCGASFASSSQLAAHKRIHLERPYACPNCDKKFINPHKLRRHEVVHTGAKDFKCPSCTYMCNVKSNLKKHCNAVHLMDYPPPDKRIKIVPQIKGISDSFAVDNALGNSGVVAIGNAAENSDAVDIDNAAGNSSRISIESTTGNSNVRAIDNAAGNSDITAVGSTLGNSDAVAIGGASCDSGTVANNVTAGNTGLKYLSNNPCSAGAIAPNNTTTVNSEQVATGNIARNVCREATNTYDPIYKQEFENHFLVESKVVNNAGVPVAGHVLDQQRMVSDSHASNASLVPDKNNPGNFVLLLNSGAPSDTQYTTARRDLSLQQNLVTFVADEVSGLSFQQV